MDWFKHSTGSHDYPGVSDAMDEFGHMGYSVFFITLELYGNEYNHLDSEGWLRLSKRFFQRKLRLSSTKVQQILNFYSERQRILTKYEENYILINCPKFVDIASNWTKRKALSPTESLQSPSVAPTAIEEKRREENKNKEKSIGDKPPSTRFTPPTLEQVIAYCQERKNSVDPQRWLNHYTAKGWMIGKNKMKDWKAAVRTWENNQGGSSSGARSQNPRRSIEPGESDPFAGFGREC